MHRFQTPYQSSHQTDEAVRRVNICASVGNKPLIDKSMEINLFQGKILDYAAMRCKITTHGSSEVTMTLWSS